MPDRLPEPEYLYQPQVVRRLLLVTHEQTATPAQPCKRPLHDKPPRRIPHLPLRIRLLVTDAAYVLLLAVGGNDAAGRRCVKAFVQA